MNHVPRVYDGGSQAYNIGRIVGSVNPAFSTYSENYQGIKNNNNFVRFKSNLK